ncbi:hypothetical protein ACLOAV_010144 [Pseudogymnoascus australis]
MSTPSQEDSRDRRRRQNRESQRRWRERYRQVKPEDAKKLNGTLPDAHEALLDTIPPMSDLQSQPHSQHLQHLLEPLDHNGYLVQSTDWTQDQPTGQPDANASWPPIDVKFHFQQGEHCASTQSQNDKPSRESFTADYLNGLEVQALSDYFVSSQIRGQFSQYPPVGTCNPVLLTPPASPSSAGIGAFHESSNSGGRCKETETASTAVETIRDVQLLYSIGVKAGFLKPDEKVKYYLAAMKRIYHKAPTLMDEDDEGLSGCDLDEWGCDGAQSDGDKLALPPQY